MVPILVSNEGKEGKRDGKEEGKKKKNEDGICRE